MFRRLFLAFALVAVTGGCSFTLRGYHDHGQHHDELHVHDDFCGHVWGGHGWVHLGVGHRHSHGCGHHWRDGRWCALDGWSGPAVHVHSTHCGHVWADTEWVVCGSGHVHQDGCGHHWRDGRWSVVRHHGPAVVFDGGHRCHGGCQHWWDGGRLVVTTRHRHGARCGHALHGGVWIVVP